MAKQRTIEEAIRAAIIAVNRAERKALEDTRYSGTSVTDDLHVASEALRNAQHDERLLRGDHDL